MTILPEIVDGDFDLLLNAARKDEIFRWNPADSSQLSLNPKIIGGNLRVSDYRKRGGDIAFLTKEGSYRASTRQDLEKLLLSIFPNKVDLYGQFLAVKIYYSPVDGKLIGVEVSSYTNPQATVTLSSFSQLAHLSIDWIVNTHSPHSRRAPPSGNIMFPKREILTSAALALRENKDLNSFDVVHTEKVGDEYREGKIILDHLPLNAGGIVEYCRLGVENVLGLPGLLVGYLDPHI